MPRVIHSGSGAPEYGGHAAEQRVPFVWPATGWLRGYRIDLVDSAGTVLPRVMGVPLVAAQQLVAYFMLVNPTDADIVGASLRFTFPWTPERASDRPKDALPLVVDANPRVGGVRTFDLPPGISATNAEFSLPVGGRLRAAGAHLHDYAVEIRLEDVRSGRVLARLTAEREPYGRVKRVSMERFIFTRGGLRLDANRPYRVVAVYDNPTCEPITGAMAFIAGPFIPDDFARWPAVDRTNPLYVEDQALLKRGGQHAEPAHIHTPATPATVNDGRDHTPPAQGSAARCH